MSVEHLVLIKIHPDGRIERTKRRPLFYISIHTTRGPYGRYYHDALNEWQILKEVSMKRREAEHRKWEKELPTRKRRDRKELQELQLEDEHVQLGLLRREGLEEEQLEEEKEESDSKEEQPDSDEEEELDDRDTEKHTTWPTAQPTAEPRSIGSMAITKTFTALTHFLNVSARQQIPPSKPKKGVFPTEIYRNITECIKHLRHTALVCKCHGVFAICVQII